jgi:thiamine transport system permease protein
VTGRVPRLGSVVAVAVAVLVLAPVAAVAWRSVRVDDAWSLDAFTRILGSPRTWRLVGVTVLQALVSTAVTLAVGLPVAWVLGVFRFPGRRLVRGVALVPFVLPSVVLASAVAALLGPAGVVDLRGTWWAVLTAHAAFNLAVVVFVVGDACGRVGPAVEEAARSLGAGQLGALTRAVVPAVRPAIVSAGAVVFLLCLTSFGVLVVLGGGRVTTVEVEVVQRATRQFDLPGAAVLSLVQLVCVVVSLVVVGRLHRRRGAPTGRPRRRVPVRRSERWAVVGAVVTVAVVSGLPLAALVDRSFRLGRERTWSNWTNLGSVLEGTGLATSPLAALGRSLSVAAVAALVATLVAVPAAAVAARAPGRTADRAIVLPLAVSATTLGLGVLLLAGRPPLDLRGSWWLVPALQALVAIPLVVRVVAPALRSLPDSTLESAATLGAGARARWWRVELPSVRAAVAAGAGVAFVACLGEFGATVFVARADRATVPVAIGQLASRPGAAGIGQATALSCILVVVCGAVLLLVDRLGEVGPLRTRAGD